MTSCCSELANNQFPVRFHICAESESKFEKPLDDTEFWVERAERLQPVQKRSDTNKRQAPRDVTVGGGSCLAERIHIGTVWGCVRAWGGYLYVTVAHAFCMAVLDGVQQLAQVEACGGTPKSAMRYDEFVCYD